MRSEMKELHGMAMNRIDGLDTEMHALHEGLKTEMRTLSDETRAQMRALDEEVISRIA